MHVHVYMHTCAQRFFSWASLRRQGEVKHSGQFLAPTSSKKRGEGEKQDGEAQSPHEGDLWPYTEICAPCILDPCYPNKMFTSYYGWIDSKDMGTEQNFQDGMLTKLSKITDLMTRLDSLNHGDDKSRVGKSMAYP